MAISLYSGVPDSYKSYHATSDSLNWLASGKTVIANYNITASSYFGTKKKLGDFYFVPDKEITVSYLIGFALDHHKPGLKAQTLVIIDEAGTKFNPAFIGSKKERADWIKFFSIHRKLNFDIVLIAQQDRMIDRQIRGCIESEFKHRSVRCYGRIGWFLSLFSGGLFATVEYYYANKTKLNSSMHRFIRKRACCYDTMTLFDNDVLSKLLKDRRNSNVVEPESLSAAVSSDSVLSPDGDSDSVADAPASESSGG